MRNPTPSQFGLFGGVEKPRSQAKHFFGNPRPKGFAAPPGTGPEGETCGTCAHCRANRLKHTYYKCALMVRAWTGGRASDVLLRSPACRHWQAGAPSDSHIRIRTREP